MSSGANKKNHKGVPIEEPEELDVLCGRGGMSNHHAGNEWYRRLIKSNRPLYRACPKHTKLLVSKAIVQAVEQQGGRFLERPRGETCWYECTYKRAVDKTSQGLRERDREQGDETGATDKDLPVALNGKSPYFEQQVDLPDAFSGKTRVQPKLSVLADAALEQAHRMDGLPRSASQLMGGSAAPSATAMPAPRRVQGMLPPMATAAAGMDPPPKPRQNLKKGPPPRHLQQQPKKRSTAAAEADPPAKRIKTGSNSNKNRSDEEEDFCPLPPTLDQRESSMFRLLKHTKLLLQESDTWSKSSIDNKSAAKRLSLVANRRLPLAANKTAAMKQPQNRDDGSNSNSELSDPRETAALKKPHEIQHQQTLQKADHATLSTSLEPGASTTLTNASLGPAAAPKAEKEEAESDNPPALTRLTSQMSDWLTGFWPVPTRGSSLASGTVAARQKVDASDASKEDGEENQQQQQVFMHNALEMGDFPFQVQPTVRQLAEQNFKKDVAGRIVNVLPLRVDPVQINQIPPMKASATIKDETAKRNKRKSASTLPQFLDGPQPDSLAEVDDAAPTELEQSVSATLLKLARTPSKLLTGFTSFFDKNRGEGNLAHFGPPGADFGVPQSEAPVVGTRRTGGSLLDDYDEVPVTEQKMKAGARQASGSHLDDGNDTHITEHQMQAKFTKL